MVRRVLVFALVGLFAGCAAPPPSPPAYDPGVGPEDFVAGIRNPFLPWTPGAYWVYEARTPEGRERIDVVVLPTARAVMGVQATVVRDTVTLEGALIEDTYDWYAEDRAGNVWYLGEDSKEYQDGRVVSTAGSWEWGVDGALPGIVMKAAPAPDGEPYFQEFLWGEAVDEAAVIDTGRVVMTAAGTFSDTVTTREWTRLSPGVEELAHYARDVGVVLKEAVAGDEAGQKEELVEHGRR